MQDLVDEIAEGSSTKDRWEAATMAVDDFGGDLGTREFFRQRRNWASKGRSAKPSLNCVAASGHAAKQGALQATARCLRWQKTLKAKHPHIPHLWGF